MLECACAQVGVVRAGQAFPVWVRSAQLLLRVTSATPAPLVRLVRGAELAVAPRPRTRTASNSKQQRSRDGALAENWGLKAGAAMDVPQVWLRALVSTSACGVLPLPVMCLAQHVRAWCYQATTVCGMCHFSHCRTPAVAGQVNTCLQCRSERSSVVVRIGRHAMPPAPCGWAALALGSLLTLPSSQRAGWGSALTPPASTNWRPAMLCTLRLKGEGGESASPDEHHCNEWQASTGRCGWLRSSCGVS